MATEKRLVAQLGESDPVAECPVHGCAGLCFDFGVVGYGGYVTGCFIHATRLIDDAIESGAMVPETGSEN